MNVPAETLNELYWGENLTLSQLAKSFDVYPETIRYHMIKNRIPRRTKSQAMTGKPKSEEHRQQLSKARLQPHLIKSSINNLPKNVSGINNPMYGRRHSKESINKMKRTKALANTRILDNISTKRLYSMYWEKKLSLHEIAKIFGISYGCVHKEFTRRKIKRRNLAEILAKRGNNKRKLRHTSSKELRRMYYDEKKSLSEIARRFGVSYATVHREFIKRLMPRRDHLHAVLRGSNHPYWKGGQVYYYGPNWHQQRKKALERDRHICQICGALENGKDHDIHHIIPFKHFGIKKYVQANNLSNLITLCQICHLKVERGVIAL